MPNRTPAIERLIAHIVVTPGPLTSDCWVSTYRTNSPYGYTHMLNDEDVRVYCHRLSYEHFIGPVPARRTLDHLCRVTACVNPRHLEPVPHRTNLLRGNTIVANAAAKTHCPQGHPYDAANTVMDQGKRRCLTCRRAYDRRRQPRRR
jgi:hypothetical protein